MTVTVKVLIPAKTAENSQTTQYTAVNCKTIIDKFTATNLALLKRIAMGASPKIRPFKTDSGYEYYVCFAGLNTFRDLKASLETINKDARPREQNGVDKNPLFQDGDQIYDGVIVRQVPEISSFVTNVWQRAESNRLHRVPDLSAAALRGYTEPMNLRTLLLSTSPSGVVSDRKSVV